MSTISALLPGGMGFDMSLEAGNGEARRGGVGRAPDRQRLNRIAEHTRGPGWLREIVALLADEAGSVPPLKDDRSQLPEFIYRH